MPAPRRAPTKQRPKRGRLGSRLLQPARIQLAEFTRSFNGTSDVLEVTGSAAQAPTTAITLAALWKPSATSESFGSLIQKLHGTNLASYGIQQSGTTARGYYAQLNGAGGTTNNFTGTNIPVDTWQLFVFRWATGETMQLRAYNTAGTIEDTVTSSGVVSLTIAYDAGVLRFGQNEATGNLGGTLAVAGLWPSKLTDPQVLTLLTGLQEWLDLSPANLWAFNQSSTATSVVDLAGTANQSAITGTTATVDSPAGFDWTLTTGTNAAAAAAAVPFAAADASVVVGVNADTAPLDFLATGAVSAAVTVDAGAATVALVAADASVQTTGTTNANAGSATITLAAADAAVALTVDAAAAAVPLAAADAAASVAVNAGSATITLAAADATVSTTGSTNVSAGSATVGFVAADASVAVVVDADPATVAVAAADALANVGAQAGTATVPVAAADASVAVVVAADAAVVPFTAADATTSTLALTNADAQTATLPLAAADASVAATAAAGSAAVPVTAADAVAVSSVNVDAGPATLAMAAADASTAITFTAEAAAVPLVAAAPGWGITAAAATLPVVAADATIAVTANAGTSTVPFVAADPSVFIPPPVPPPRWVEGDTTGSGQVEGVLVGAGIVEGGTSV